MDSLMAETTVEPTLKKSRYLTEIQRRSIIAEVASGKSQESVAQAFGVHVNTVGRLAREVRKGSKTLAQSGEWRKTLYETMIPESVSAVRSSINDSEDVHKAATTAMQHLKAVGVVQGDVTVTNIVINVHDMPANWRDKFSFSEEDVRDI